MGRMMTMVPLFCRRCCPSTSPPMQRMSSMRYLLLLLFPFLQLFPAAHPQPQSNSTPVIGGECSLDSPDVHIGGKQTQFFLRCESTPESAPGEGVWVVKSRNAGSTANKIPAAAIVLQQQNGAEEQKKLAPIKATSYVCDLVSDAQEHGYCSTSEKCLQPVYTDRNAFLQCDSTTRRWVKKHCQPGFNFDFERQACIAHTVKGSPHLHFRQFPKAETPSKVSHKKHQQQRGIVCTYAQCSVPAAPCNIGNCNNGYCCSAAVGALPKATFPGDPATSTSNGESAVISANPMDFHDVAEPSATSNSSTLAMNAIGLPAPPQIPSILVIALNDPPAQGDPFDSQLQMDDFPASLLHPASSFTLEMCSSGFHSPIRCLTPSGGCPPGLTCEPIPRLCCPFPLPKVNKASPQQKIGGGAKWGQKTPNGNGTNRRRMALRLRRRPGRNACPGGLPPLGPCIGGRCAMPGTICASPANVCCAPAVVPAVIPATVCPDGTQAAGACVNGQCGAGFTCNQGLCCTNSSQTPRCLDGSQSIGACIQGKCGTGYTCTTGNICCPSQLNLCPPGQTSIGQAVNGRCPPGFTNFNGQCCGPQSAQSQVTCSVEDSSGPCDSNQQCPEPGYACDVPNNWCCPQVIGDAIGPCIQGEGGNRLCPEGYACVGEGEGQCFRLDTGTCPPEEQAGPCAPDGSCPPGYECIEGFCCQTDGGGTNTPTSLFRQRRRRRGTPDAPSSAFLRLIRQRE